MACELVECGADRVYPLGVPMVLVEGKCVSKIPWDPEAIHMDRPGAQRVQHVGIAGAKCLPWRVVAPVAVGRTLVSRVGLVLPVSVAKEAKSVVGLSQDCCACVYGSPFSHDVDEGVEECRLNVGKSNGGSSDDGGGRMGMTSASWYNGRSVDGTDGVVPVRVVREGVIKHTGIPWGVGGEMDVGKGRPFGASVGNHGKVRKAIDDVKGKDMAIMCQDVLSATNRDGAIIDPQFHDSSDRNQDFSPGHR